MRLFELFQKYYKYSRLDHEHYMFTTDQDLRYLVHFKEISIPIGWQLEKAMGVAFALTKDDGEILDLIQNTGDAFTVFSTVGKIVQEHMQTVSNTYLFFGATLHEPSRLKLYEMFIKFLPKFMPDWELDSKSEEIFENTRVWILKRKGSR